MLPLKRPSGSSLLLALAAVGLIMVLLDRLFPPPLARLEASGSSLVVAADGSPLRAFADEQGVWRHRVTLDAVSPLYIQALIHYEDRWFFRHPGVNPASMLRALGQALWHREAVSGGSTLTMQVARLLEPIPRTPLGKLKQMARALQLEARYDKRAILEIYLNLAPFGGTIEGVQAASQAYLGKSAHQLSHAEAALLVVLPQQPSRLRPDRAPERARAARDKVLARMAERGIWDVRTIADARMEAVDARRLRVPMQAPLLAQRLRHADPAAGLIQSTIDAALQSRAEALVARALPSLPPRTSVALMVLRPADAAVLAYVGSADLGDAARAGHVDMVRAARSPGSTLKPFVYGMAIDQGLIHSHSLLVDAPQSFSGYQPSNFQDHFQGPVSATAALRLSLNVPAVDLLDRVGPRRFGAQLEHAGITLRLPADSAPNLAMILGGAATSLEELVGGYAALARDGLAVWPRLRTSEPLIERRLLSPGAAWIVRSMLARDPRDSYSVRQIDTASQVELAWKTGTSYGFRDAWALGVAPTAVVGVWVGRPDGTPMPGQYGAITALPLLIQMVDALPGGRRQTAAAPAVVESVEICWPLGLRLGDTPPAHCHRRHQAWTLAGQLPPTLPDRDATRLQGRVLSYWSADGGRTRQHLGCLGPDSRSLSVARWPALVYPWLGAATRARSSLPPLAPQCPDDGLSTDLRIAGVGDGSSLRPPSNRNQGLHIEVRALGTSGLVRWLLDGRYVAQSIGDRATRIDLDSSGDRVLSALDEQGGHAQVRFRVLGLADPQAARLTPSSAATPGR